MLAFEKFIPAKVIDRAVLRRGHQPGAGVIRDARLRPLFECGNESVLRELFGNTDIAHNARKAGDNSGRLNPPDRVDRAMCVGSRHGYPSHHLQLARASPRAPTMGSLPSVCAKTPMLWKRTLPARRSGESPSRPPTLASVSCAVP